MRRHNPALRELGFAIGDRVVVVHADDVGMCDATVDALLALAGRGGLISSASLMVPCPGFAVAAARCRDRVELDLGVHLTLTSEWEDLRWGPVDEIGGCSGLVDEAGCFHRHQDCWIAVDAAAAQRELAAQVDLALAAGLDVTHLDPHMCATLHPALIDGYGELGRAHGIPVLAAREAGWRVALGETRIAAWERRGLPIFDELVQLPLDGPVRDRLGLTMRILDALPAGLTYVIAHPATDTPELRRVAADWRHRVADFEVLGDERLIRHAAAAGIEVIGWRPLRDAMRTREAR